MGGDNFEPEITSIVRRYSEKVAEEMPNDTLAQSLGTWDQDERRRENEDAEWQRWLRFAKPASDTESRILEKQCQEVTQAWQEFKEHFPNLHLEEGVSHPPTIETLHNEVNAAKVKWATKKEKGFGKAKDNVLSFLETLEGHKALFSVIPSGDKYTSLFAGVISSVVKASVNYEHIAEGFSRALAEMSADLIFVRNSTTISTSANMKHLVITLYVQVFKFLCEMMTWYQSAGKRFRASFNSRFYDKKIDERVHDIKLLVKRVEQETSIETQRQVKTTGQDVKVIMHVLRDHMREIGQENRHQLEELVERKFDDWSCSLQLGLGRTMAGLLSSNTQRMLPALRDQIPTEQERMLLQNIYSRMDFSDQSLEDSPPSPVLQLSVASARLQDEEDMTVQKQRDVEVQQYFEPVRGFAEDCKPAISREVGRSDPDELGLNNLPSEVTDALATWSQKRPQQTMIKRNKLESVPSSSQNPSGADVLWVEGSGVDQFDRCLTFMAYHVYLNAVIKRIPVISFFHKRRYRFQPKDMTSKRAGLTALLYSVIDQLMPFLPPEFEARGSLSPNSFNKLGGILNTSCEAAESVKTALDVIEALLILAGPNLIFVIDGVEMIEHQRNLDDLKRLCHLLRTRGDTSRRKILYITSGSCSLLAKTTDPIAERVEADRTVQARRKTPIPGATSLAAIRL
ncbi:hypothetical protein BJ170DRAFT_694947 [Xylariales sp. AK1849]|nr:hypothetical protein BJ170DRAFT_694947 [Xylariales sp. AK1849]